jgi:hypothetical protein
MVPLAIVGRNPRQIIISPNPQIVNSQIAKF